MIKVGIIGATGYTGCELVRILLNHDEAQIVALSAKDRLEEELAEIYPNFRGMIEAKVEKLDIEAMASEVDVVFTALPHGVSMEIVPDLLAKGIKVIDLGADYRFKNLTAYEKWYNIHQSPELLDKTIYGLPELHRDIIKQSNLVGNPGCYPTSIILALTPLLRNKWIDVNSIIADSKSGVTGAGCRPSEGSHYISCNESIKAYKVAAHRHTAEIEEQLSEAASEEVIITFTPHLVPMNRGILSTIYANLNKDADLENIHQYYQDFYHNEEFVRILPLGKMPETKYVRGSNYCDIGMTVDQRTNRVIVVSAIDNLVKGASGQAVQNMNLMFGLPENMGLKMPALYP